MPIYEYQCTDCGHEFEAIQKISDERLTECPDCKKDTLKKKVTSAAFRLGGSGWYETDFKEGNKKNLVDKDNNGDKGSKAEPKPAKHSCGSGSCGCA